MILAEIFKKYDFETVFAELSEIFPDVSRKRSEIESAYDFLLLQTPVTSKKKIRYRIIEDEESFDCFVGAEDSCFESNWNVILGKEVTRDDDVEISDLEIATNSLLCILLIGFAPKRFISLQQDLQMKV